MSLLTRLIALFLAHRAPESPPAPEAKPAPAYRYIDDEHVDADHDEDDHEDDEFDHDVDECEAW